MHITTGFIITEAAKKANDKKVNLPTFANVLPKFEKKIRFIEFNP